MLKPYYFVLIITLCGISACNLSRQAAITNVASITRVKMNDELQTVISKLGIDPYDFKASTQGGYTIYIWKYKVMERVTDHFDNPGDEKTGLKKYNAKLKELTAIFDASYRLIGLYSQGGVILSQDLSIRQNLLEKLQSSGSCQTCLAKPETLAQVLVTDTFYTSATTKPQNIPSGQESIKLSSAKNNRVNTESKKESETTPKVDPSPVIAAAKTIVPEPEKNEDIQIEPQGDILSSKKDIVLRKEEEQTEGVRFHKVEEGETLQVVADRYHVSVADLQKWNYMPNGTEVGKNLVVHYPQNKKEEPQVNSLPSQPVTITKPPQAALPKETAKTTVVGPDGTKYEVSADGYHVVKYGQTFYRIALIYGLTIKQLQDLNNMNSPAISVGQKLRVKSK